MKTHFLFLLALFLTISGIAQSGLKTREIKILPNSRLSISGTTNINEFECDFNTFNFKNDSFKVHFIEKGDILNFRNSVLPLENSDFDCGNRQINKDFHELLETKRFPKILLKLKKIDMSTKDNTTVTINFNIAGVDKDYKFPVDITRNKQLCFDGKLHLNITDFNLKAPSKIFGLIELKEEIVINFNLNIQT
ncbi:YceI-like domain-containing protein [Salegentibacter sp. 24]|uniref:YceI family protein n=1 Tax=Salegentibacter sp. 24 TaxID=2183986 RepID=UPI0010E2C1EE|nr:YceI family protein [Salegentibacter sp. 24]TDN95281.1 YceI-like domain-containing protein [Salegentibacter sp. 24]